MNAVILASNAYKAVKEAYTPVSKLPENMRKLPICQHMRIATHDGRVIVTCLDWNTKEGCLDARTGYIPARIDSDFAICVPARAFKDWLHASQLTKEEKKADYPDERMNIAFDAQTMSVTISTKTTRATFKGLSTDEFPAFPVSGKWIN